jgi:Protein-tyrosine phosphatase
MLNFTLRVKFNLVLMVLVSLQGKAACSTRLIFQYHYLSWPDKKVPSTDDIASVVDLMVSVNGRWLSTNSSAPLVVHCRQVLLATEARGVPTVALPSCCHQPQPWNCWQKFVSASINHFAQELDVDFIHQ